MNEEIKIFIATHKKFEFPYKEPYVPLHVGAEGKQDLGYLKDNSNVNISLKNPYYCELTGLYWIWKNINSDIVGLVHYRRYFYKKYLFNKVNNILTEDDIKKYLENYDVLIAQRGYTWFSEVDIKYCESVVEGASDIKITEEAIKKLYPEYTSAYDKVMKSNHYSQFNMMICRKDVFDEYCEWLFDVLGYVENHLEIPLSERKPYNARVFGFLSERLMNVWIEKNSHYKVKELPVLNTEESIVRQKVENCIKRILKGVI